MAKWQKPAPEFPPNDSAEDHKRIIQYLETQTDRDLREFILQAAITHPALYRQLLLDSTTLLPGEESFRQLHDTITRMTEGEPWECASELAADLPTLLEQLKQRLPAQADNVMDLVEYTLERLEPIINGTQDEELITTNNASENTVAGQVQVETPATSNDFDFETLDMSANSDLIVVNLVNYSVQHNVSSNS